MILIKGKLSSIMLEVQTNNGLIIRKTIIKIIETNKNSNLNHQNISRTLKKFHIVVKNLKLTNKLSIKA